ncbi:MAG: 2Fe-2S iron-sulfur cluster binding domain-containing protein [Proteobacteria bacterium]|nr:2Fe-2S iron-sulfur cluster binding domain-containing protein [Pseudomonadota bacterium]
MSATFAFTLNGRPAQVAGSDDDVLVHALRGELGLPATRFGCGAEACGACLVLLDGAPVQSCTLRLDRVAGRAVVTVEGLGTPAAPHPLQTAVLDEQAGQCGYCLSGIQIAAAALLARNPDPSRAEIAAALAGNLCRCGAHNRMIAAVQRAARSLRGEAS